MKHWNQTPPPDDDNMRSIMLDELAIVAARGGLAMEEKLKTLYGGWNIRSCSFLWSSDPDHQLFKQKIAEYTKFPPPLPSPTPPAPAAQNTQGIRFRERLALCSDPSAFSVGIPQGMMRKELGIIKFTAQFVVRYGYKFRDALWGRVSTETQFKFLDQRDRSDIRCHLFSELHLGYSLVIKSWSNHPAGMEAVLEGFFTAFNAFKKKQEDEEQDEVVDKVVTDRRDFLVSDEYFVDIENKELPPLGPHGRFRVLPGPDTFRVGIPEGGMMRKELGIIKLTAQFVVRYGNEFWDALWDRVSTGTEFQFLERNPGNDVRGRYTLFSQLLLAYGIVIEPWGLRPRKSDTGRMEAVLQRVFAAFNAFKEKQEKEGEDELVDKVVTDRRDFVVSDEYFVDIEFTTPLPEPTPAPQTPQMGSQFDLSPLMMQPSPMHAGSSSRPPPPLHEEPEPKRVKLDESALVSEEVFLAQHPGSFTFTIWEATAGRLFQITVQSLSENVANLKEKIAGETGIPANQQKLMGKSVFLKDDMSLARYNLGVVGEEVLILA